MTDVNIQETSTVTDTQTNPLNSTRPFAIITGASTGIGYELARCCAEKGFDLLIAADEPDIEKAAEDLGRVGVKVDFVQANLATPEGVEKLYDASQSRPVDVLCANAGVDSEGLSSIKRLMTSNASSIPILAARFIFYTKWDARCEPVAAAGFLSLVPSPVLYPALSRQSITARRHSLIPFPSRCEMNLKILA